MKTASLSFRAREPVAATEAKGKSRVNIHKQEEGRRLLSLFAFVLDTLL